MSSPIWIGDHRALSFGWYHRATDAQRDVGVVLCNPLAYESMCTHRTYRVLAERLAELGFPVVRFDYHGTGDSSGDENDPDRIGAWKRSVHDAIDSVKQFSGVKRVALFGMRIGATLALSAAADRDDIAAIVAWALIPSGKAYIRELRAFNMIKGDAVGEQHLEAAGLMLTPETVQALPSLDLLAIDKPPAEHLLFLQRDATSNEAKIAKHFGAPIELIAGYDQMMRDAHESVVPSEVLDRITGWLDERFPERTGAGVNGPLSLQGHPIGDLNEQPLFFGPDSRMFGILTTSPQWVRTHPTVLLLNTGSNHHVGQHRMSVTLARRLARLGFATFRFDINGLGDSPLVGDKRGRRHYAPDAIDDVRAAMAVLKSGVGSDRFVLVGLCSGAYLSYSASAVLTDIVGQVVINLQSIFAVQEEFVKQGGFKSNRHYKDRILNLDTYRRLLRGDVHVRVVGKMLAQRALSYAKTRFEEKLQAFRRSGPRNPVEAAIFATVNRGADTLAVFSSDDHGIDQLDGFIGDRMAELRARPNFHYHIIDGADHTFSQRQPRLRLIEMIINHISERFGSVRPQASPYKESRTEI